MANVSERPLSCVPSLLVSSPVSECGLTTSPATAVESVKGDLCSAPDAQSQFALSDQTNLLPLRKLLPIFFSLALCIIVSALDSVIVATALPTISATFKAGSVVSWVPAAFLLTSTVFQPLYGRFSDIFGRKAALSVSMIIFMIGNLISGFSKSISQLIVARGISGAGGGGIISMCQIVISDIVSLRDRGKYQGIIGVVLSAGYGVGPIIGGILVQKVTWRWCFWVTIPISFTATGIVLFVLPLKPVKGSMKTKLLVIDYLGTGLSLMGSTLIILPLVWGGVKFPWVSPEVLATLLGGVFVVCMFCFWEWKGAKLPIVPMYIFRHSTVTGVYITMFVNGFVLFSSIYYIPQYFQVVLGYSPIRAGVFLIPYLVGQTTASWAAGMLVSRTGRYRTIIHTGFAIWSLACGLISTITSSSPKAVLVVYMLLAGMGAGQTLQTTTVAAQASVARRDMSVVTAFRNFIRLLGGALTLAIGATIINNTLRGSMVRLRLPPSLMSMVIDKPSDLAHPALLGLSQAQATYILSNGYTHGFRRVFILNASCTAIATIASIVLIKHKELTRGDESRYRSESEEKMQPIGNGDSTNKTAKTSSMV